MSSIFRGADKTKSVGFIIAEALERTKQRGEALNEYVSLSKFEHMSLEQRGQVSARVAHLRK